MTEFVKGEIRELMELLKTTRPDPRQYREVLANIEIVLAQAEMLEEAESYAAEPAQACAGTPVLPEAQERENGADIIGFTPPSDSRVGKVRVTENKVAEPEEPNGEPVAAETEPAKQYKPEEVRTALVAARRRGVNVTALMQEFGVEVFSAFPVGKYGELLEKLKE